MSGAPVQQARAREPRHRRVALLAAVGLVLGVGLTAASAASPHVIDSPTLYVATSGSDTANTCQIQALPCQTISHAITQAEADSGDVTIEVSPGSYPEQLTISPPASSPMTALTITDENPSSGAVVVEPTTITDNVTLGSTGHFFDNGSGPAGAIVGVQTGSTDSAAGASAAGNHATVTIRFLTVSGAGLTKLPPGGQLMGIAFVDTGGAVLGNTIQDVQQPAHSGQAAVEGIQVIATSASATVDIAGNSLPSEAGHDYIDLMATSPGALRATVRGNTLTGNSTSSLTPAAQFGVVAGGLTNLTVEGNSITGFQSPYGDGAVWLDSQASGAYCSVQDNTLTGDDNGVYLNGANGCSVIDNSIAAGQAGVEDGPGYGSYGDASSGNAIYGNVITGQQTVGTTSRAHYATSGTTAVAAITGQPIDGILVWEGESNSIHDNLVSGFVTDVYVGEDPVYLDNLASWGSSEPATYASYDNSGNVVFSNDIETLATPASGSGVTGYGAANLNNGTAFTLDATQDYWGCSTGPNTSGCTTASTGVDFTPYLTAATTNGYVPIPPTRVLDTRSGQGGVTGPIAGGTVHGVTIPTSVVPDGATAIAVNVTAVTPNHDGYLQVYPAGGSAGSTSTINYQPPQTTANFVVVALPANRTIDFYSGGPSTLNVLMDVAGYFTSRSDYTAQTPVRILDTRPTSQVGAITGPLSANTVYPVQVAGKAGVPSDATAVALNVTAVDPTSVGNLRIYPAGEATPAISNINYTHGVDEANFVILRLPTSGSSAGKLDLYSNQPSSGQVNVLVDVLGYFTGSTTAVTTAPARILDTRTGSGLTQGLPDPLKANTPYAIQVTGKAGVPADAEAVLANVTVVTVPSYGNLRVYPESKSVPTISTINYVPRETTANFTIVELSSSGKLELYSNGSPANVLVDVFGYIPLDD